MSMTKRKRMLSLVVAVVFAFSGFAVFGGISGKTYAVEKESWSVMYYPNAGSYNNFWLGDTTDMTIDMSTCTTTNDKVAVIKEDKEGQQYCIVIKGLGKADVTYKSLMKGEKEYVEHQVSLNVYDTYAKPVKSFKIGKKNLTSKFNKRDSYWQAKTLKGKLVIKPKKGWKITSIYYAKSPKAKPKKIKNKSKVKIKKGQYMYASFKKGKRVMTLWVSVGT